MPTHDYDSLPTIPEDSADELGLPINATQVNHNTYSAIGEKGSTCPPEEVKVYKRRWYILVLFSLMAMTQGGVWNTWGPITRSAEQVFNWRDQDIALLSNWGPITYIISMAGFSWLLDVKGLRLSSIICASLVFGGTILRCITSQQPVATWLIHSGHILNGLAGPVAMAACPLISNAWFPPQQRATATAISAVFNYVGVSLSFVIGPQLVRENQNARNSKVNMTDIIPLPNTTEPPYIEVQRNDIMKLMYIECGWMGAIFLLILIYFPAKPSIPPSKSASKERIDFKQGLLDLFRLKNFWLVAIPYAVSTGVYGAWGAVLGVNLKNLDILQTESGWIGFYSTIAGCVSGFLIARLADCLAGNMKTLLLLLMAGSAASSVWVTIILAKYISFSTIQLYISCIICGFCVNGAIPIFYELSCETSFPIAEGVTSGLLTFLNNVLALIFLLVLLIPNLPTIWMNWCLLGSCAFCFIVLLFYKEKYTRLKLDTAADYQPYQDPSSGY